jgi:cytochrome c-type biogenesis protein CcmF
VTTFGQLCLLAAFVASGYSAFTCFAGWQRRHSIWQRAGTVAGIVGFLALTLVSAILAESLLLKDFRFAYVAQYASRGLPWHYALSAFWVGQAGSLLFWAWSVGLLAMLYRFWPRHTPSLLREPAFAILMAYQCFLVAIMVFGADPMQPSLAVPREGGGLSPLLQHPAMLLHPPVVFLGYAGCAIPFALAFAALLSGRLDADWIRDARPWAFFAWAVQGIGILVGAYWAYEELGWGGYWSWDPVENGSLIPWLTATAMIHAAMLYRQRGELKRTTIWLAVATFAACNFAAFLTRSGIFSSLHAFSQSPIGWMFLALIVALAVGTAVLLMRRRVVMASDNPIPGLSSKEGVATASVFALIVLAAVVFTGTASMPISQVLFPHKVLLGPGFYNGALMPTGLLLLAAMAVAPLLRWGGPPEARQAKAILLATVAGAIAAGLAWFGGLRHPLEMAVVGLATMTAIALAASWLLDARWRLACTSHRDGADIPVCPTRYRPLGQTGMSAPPNTVLRICPCGSRRRTYAGYVMHLGVACLAIGIAGSSLGTQQHDVTLATGESIRWAGRDIRFISILQDRSAQKLVVRAELEVTADGASPYTLRPAQEYYFLQSQWNSEVAIHSTWGSDFYTILHSGEGQDRVQLTLVENPMMRWMWLSGWIMVVGAVPWFWPAERRAASDAGNPAVRRKASQSPRKVAA